MSPNPGGDFCVNVTEAKVSPGMLSFQPFQVKLIGSLKLNYSNGQRKIWIKTNPKVTDPILMPVVSIWCAHDPPHSLS